MSQVSKDVLNVIYKAAPYADQAQKKTRNKVFLFVTFKLGLHILNLLYSFVCIYTSRRNSVITKLLQRDQKVFDCCLWDFFET